MHRNQQPGLAGRHTAPRAPLALVMVASFIVSMTAAAQQIVKWTDDNGHVHYSDHAPAGHTPVNSVDLPKSAARSSEPAAQGDAPDPQHPSESNNGEGLASAFDAEQAASAEKQAQKKQAADQQQARAAARRKADQAVIDECKANHEPNCRAGADAIRQRNHLAAEMQCTNPAACRKVEEIWQQQQQSLGN